MRLDEFESPGVFCALKIDSTSASALVNFVETELQMKPIPPEYMHVSLAKFNQGFVDETTFPKLNLPIEIKITNEFGFFTIPDKGIRNGAYLLLEKNRSLYEAREQVLDWFNDNGIKTRTPKGRRPSRWNGWTPHISITFQDTEAKKLPWQNGQLIKAKSLLRGWFYRDMPFPITSLKVDEVILEPRNRTWGMEFT